MAEHEDVPHVRVAVVGSGFGGLGAAVRLRREGITDFVVLERAGGVGGTWRDNSYPGCACDVPSHLYSFSFAPNPDWPRTFSGQQHIRAYLEHVADVFRLRPHIRFDSEGYVYTSEASVGSIKRYTPDGKFLGMVGSAKIIPGCKHVAIDVSEDGERVFVLDITRSQIVVLAARNVEVAEAADTTTSGGE